MNLTRSLSIGVYALLISPFMAHSADSCSGGEFSQAQCNFVVPTVVSGDVSIVDSISNPSFEGKLVASCQNGNLVVGKKTCEPIDKTTCAIPASTWVSPDGKFCSHPAQNTPMKDSASSKIKSVDGKGDISYSCSVGNLNIISMNCGDSVSSEIVTETAYKSAVFSAQSASVVNDVVKLEFYDSNDSDGNASNKSRVKATALSVCNGVDYFNSSKMNDVVKTGYLDGRKEFTYEINCPITVPVQCDQDVVIKDNIRGSYDSRRGEFTNPPAYSSLSSICKSAGFESLDETIHLGLSRFTVDSYRGAFICGGKQSQCSSEPALGSPVVTGASSCTTASVKSGLLKVAKGTVPTTAFMQKEACEPLGFDGLLSVNRTSLEDSTGSFDFYSASLECTSYQLGETAPLLPSCSASGSPDGNISVSPLTCDSAEVSRTLGGGLDPATGIYSLEPSDASVLSRICNAADYGNLDKIISSISASETSYIINAQCSGFTGSGLDSCLTTDPCLGDEVSSDAQVPKIELNGVYYRDECSSITEPPSNLCESCNATTFTFNGSGITSGNSCTIDVTAALSGEVDSFSFANTSINGSVDVLCNNGSLSVSDNAICYKSCPGNVTVGWDDDRGAKSCGQTIPSGVYKHNQTVSFSSSISNTGSASFKCDGVSGQWQQQSGSCDLDCSGGINWGTGRDGNNKSKVNLCSASISPMKHLSTGSANTSTPLTTGSTSLKCDDGTISQSGSTCQSTCVGTTLSWGSQCSTTISNVTDGGTKSLNHTGSSSFASVSGSATAMCVDGRFSLSSTSCSYISKVETEVWSSWIETGRSCSLYPNANTIVDGQSFTQTKTCNVSYKRTRNINNIWNDGRVTLIRVESETKNETETSQASVKGSRAPALCAARTVSFGGACKAIIPDVQSGTGKIFSHNGYSPYASTSGSVSVSCEDGNLSTSTISCRYIVSTKSGDWGDWIQKSKSCTTPSPEKSTIDNGVLFTQYSNCATGYYRTRFGVNTWNDGTTTSLEGAREDKVENTTVTNSAYGTKAPAGPSCKYDSNNYIEDSGYDQSDYGQEGTREELDSRVWVYNGVTIYELEDFVSDRSGDRFSEVGSTVGYSRGASKSSTGSYDSYRDRYEICKN